MRSTICRAQKKAQLPGRLELSAPNNTTYARRTTQWHYPPRRRIASTARHHKAQLQGNPSTPGRFPGYAVDPLDAPLLPTLVFKSNQSPSPPPPTPVSADAQAQTPTQARTPSAGETASLAKSRIVFSTRLDGPAERAARQREIEKASTLIAGVLVPPKPEEPDNCCMSGCVNCVWDLYGEEVETWAARREEAKRAQQTQSRHETIGEQEKGKIRRGNVLADGESSSSMDDDGGGSEANWDFAAVTSTDAAATRDEAEDVFKEIPVGIREFMRTEKKLKMKLQQKRQRHLSDTDERADSIAAAR